MRLLVTGAAGFIGSNFVHYLLAQYPDVRIVNLDKLTYAGNVQNLAAIATDPRYQFVKGDISDKQVVHEILRSGCDAIVNFAAESHVDRSIENAEVFLQTNVIGTQVLLDAAHAYKVERFLQVSTDEVYGSLGPTGYFTEESPLAPNSPYAASKAAADLLVRAASHTHALGTLITRCSNNYGPYQFPEKFIPLLITNALEDKSLPIYGDGRNVRDWLYVDDHCRALDLVLQHGTPGEVYNIGGNTERLNLDMARAILQVLEKPETLITFVPDRPGHDRRYAVDCSKIRRELGWEACYSLAAGLQKTISWYRRNTVWWKRAKDDQYLEYYERHYGKL